MKLRLTLREAGGVSAPEKADGPFDLPLAATPDGTPWYPPTSVAGALRRLVDPADADRLFGFEQDAGNGQVSAIRVLAAAVTLPAGRTAERRVRNAMDRERGAPRTHHLFASEALPAGSTVEVCLRWDHAAEDDRTAVLAALRRWRPTLGRGATVGQGRAEVTALGSKVLRLGRPKDLANWLCATGPELFAQVQLEQVTPPSESEPLLDVHFRIADALHVGGVASRDDPDRVARVLSEGGEFMVPGSAWKGVLRARCEYVLRSLAVAACCSGTCGDCPTCALFGHGAPPRRAGQVADQGRRGPVRFLSGVVRPEPGYPQPEQREHVAIDRFSGGAHDGLLYTEEVLTSGTLRLRVEHDPSRPDPPCWAKGLLLAAVADIADGLVGIGAATTRGQGTLQRVNPGGQGVVPSLNRTERNQVRTALAELAGWSS